MEMFMKEKKLMIRPKLTQEQKDQLKKLAQR